MRVLHSDLQTSEVAYVDGQRNCAVALGERDVKTDVSNKETERRHQTEVYFKT